MVPHTLVARSIESLPNASENVAKLEQRTRQTLHAQVRVQFRNYGSEQQSEMTEERAGTNSNSKPVQCSKTEYDTTVEYARDIGRSGVYVCYTEIN